MKDKVKIFLKGLAIGTCDIVPGISGGTIAFITGIYTRLMDGIKAYNPKNFLNLFKGKKKAEEAARSFDVFFFLPLIIGVGLALFVASYYIPWLLDTYFVFTMSFFIGLIVSSGLYIFSHIKQHNKKNHILSVLGLLIGFSLYYIIPINPAPTYLFLFVSGLITLSATLLPGISGSYVLLILGQYEFIMSSIHNIGERFWFLASFGVGGILGIVIIARIISYFLHKHKSSTLYVLLGLVLGSLNTPVQRVIATDFVWSLGNAVFVLILFGIGIGVVLFLERLSGDGKIA